MAANLIICKCPEGQCVCYQKIRNKKGEFKILRNGKVMSKIGRQTITGTTTKRSRGPAVKYIHQLRGEQGPPGETFDPCDLTEQYEHQAMRRTFTFDAIAGPTMFSTFDAVCLNDQLIILNQKLTLSELNQYLEENHHIYLEDSSTYYVYVPHDVTVLKLRPTGYVDPQSTPAHTITANTEEQEINFVVCGSEGAGHLSHSEIFHVIRTVAKEEAKDCAVAGPQGPTGEKGEQGSFDQVELINYLQDVEYQEELHRTFTFPVSPEIFSHYSAILLNGTIINLVDQLAYADFKRYLLNQYGIYQLNETQLGVHSSSSILSLGLRPVGYTNAESNPIDFLLSTVNDTAPNFLLMGDNLSKLPYSNVKCYQNFATQNYYGRNVPDNEISGATPGSQYVNIETGQTYVYNGASWFEVVPREINGDLNIIGTLTKSAGSFLIDHPLDPKNKNLQHSFVESDEMLNVYSGNITLDEFGKGTVTLPDWFESLNMDFRYQLTSIGIPSPNVYISSEIENNKFSIAGGHPGAKISWQVSGTRQDRYANKYRIQVETQKYTPGEYLHPELYAE